MDKPLFIPLKSEYYEAFKDGSKDTEYRLHGKRWNENTCWRGRKITLSKGYGKKNRLYGVISSVWVTNSVSVAYVIQEALAAIFGPGIHEVICLEIHLLDVSGEK